jgi:hypothetical protein
VSEHPVSVRSYRPGDWFGIVGERAVVILPPSEKSRVASLWELVDDGAGFDVTLDALISGGLRELPSFVLVSTAEGETKVVLRGPARALFTVDGEDVELEGSSATTWVERSLYGVERMWITVDDQVGAETAYAVDGGLFRISALGEAPAHEGPPEYDPGPALVEDDLDDPELTTEALEVAHTEVEAADQEPVEEPDEEADGGEVEEAEEADDVALQPVGLDDLLGGPDPSEQPEDEPSPWARSPEPPSWTPTPPPMPVPVPAGPPPSPWGAPVVQPETEAMTLPPDADHDGLTRTGSEDYPQPPGIPGQPPAPDVTRPVARLMISNGEAVDVDRAIVIGRAPEARRFNATEQPRLVTVPSPHLEISATHVEVRPGAGVDHGSAVVTDLGSTNGTVLVQPGLAPEDLEPGVAVQLIPGAVIDLGDGVTIQVLQP